MTIIELLRERLEKLGGKPEFIPVSLPELKAYVYYARTVDPMQDKLTVEFKKDNSGTVYTFIGELPLRCSFRGIPLRCKENAG